MADTKTIKIKFELDRQSFQQVKTAIDSLGSSLQKMNANMPGINFGGATPSKEKTIQDGNKKPGLGGGAGAGGATMGKVILDNAAAFKKFAQEGKDASKIMTEALQRDITSQVRSLDNLKSKLHNLNDEFKLATAKQKEFLDAGNKSGASAMSQHIANLEKQLADTSGQTLKGTKELAGSKDALVAAGGGSGGKFGALASGLGYTGTGFGTGAAGMLGGIATIVGGVLAAGLAGVKESMAGTRAYSSAEANRGQMVGGDIAALRRGDISSIQARRMILQDADKRKDFEAQTGTLSKIETVADGIGGTVMDVIGKATLGLSDKLLSRKGGAIGAGLTTTAQQDDLFQKQQDMIAAQKATAEAQELRYATEYFTGNVGARTSGARIMGLGIRRKKGSPNTAVDTYGQLDADLTEKGYDLQQLIGIKAGLMGSGGNSFAGKFSYEQMAAQNAGQGGYAEAAKAMSMAAGGDMDFGRMLTRMSIGQGMNRTGRLTGSKMDVNAGMQLAGVLGGYDPRQGAVDPSTLLMGYMGGVGGSGNSLKDMMNIQAFSGGLDFANRFTTGSLDDLQKGKNTVFAANALGGGASTYAIDRLAGMDIKKLTAGMAGTIDSTSSDLGLTQDNFKDYGNKVMGSMFDNYYGGGKIGSAIDRFKKSGLGLQEYLAKNPNDVSLLAEGMSLGSGGGMEEDTALSFLRTQAGIGSGAGVKEGGVGGGPLDDVTKAFNKAQADFKRQDANRLGEEEGKGQLSADFAKAKREAEVLTSLGKDLNSSVENVSKALNQLALKINTVVGANGFKGTSK